MYRFAFRPLWLLSHLFSIFLVVLFVNLGFWQIRRLHEKEDRRDTITARTEEPAVPLEQLLSDTDPAHIEDLRYRSATVEGTYVADADVMIDNRSKDGLPGAWIVTPLRLDDGTIVAVSRGFQGFDSGRIDPPPPPSGTVDVVGTIMPWDTRNCGIRRDDGGNPCRRGLPAPRRGRGRARRRRGARGPPAGLVDAPGRRGDLPRAAARDRPRTAQELRGAVVHLRHHRGDRVSAHPASGGPGQGTRGRGRRDAVGELTVPSGDDLRTRVLDATFAEVDEHGLRGLAVEAVANRAGTSRATVYRHFPGGREELVETTLRREVERFFAVLGAEVDHDAGAADHVAALVIAAHRLLGEHRVFQRLLAAEAEVLAPPLATVYPMVHDALCTHLRAILGGSAEVAADVDVDAAADHGARMVLSYVGTAGAWDLADPEQVDALVRRRILAGVLASI